jgi:hypothetical protein
MGGVNYIAIPLGNINPLQLITKVKFHFQVRSFKPESLSPELLRPAENISNMV